MAGGHSARADEYGSRSRQTISSIETGQFNPSALLALLLARRLDKRVEDLFFLEEES
jgi:putative transcriptional regulator